MSDTDAQKLAAEFDRVAEHLLVAAAAAQHEAAYLRRDFPDPTWAPHTHQAYLLASRASRESEVRQAAAGALSALDSDYKVLRAELAR